MVDRTTESRTKPQLAALQAVYSRHDRVGDDGTSELNFHEFLALARELKLPLCTQSEEEQRRTFTEVATSGGGNANNYLVSRILRVDGEDFAR